MRGMTSLVLMVVAVRFAAGETTITKVRHEPVAPKPDAPVLVTAQVSPGASRVVLKLQAVAPGKYIRKTDPAYETEWVDFPMRDDGLEGDAKPGDGVFSYRVPGAIQKHRWLIRYRIVATGNDGKPVVAPVKESPSPNQAWWVDAGPATWSGAREPGKTPPATYSREFLGTVQSLHLIARAEDVAKSQWDGNAHKQKQAGTIVYRGLVYDHIQYSNRGQGSAHISGKNKWGIKFNSKQDLPLVDHDGVPFPDELGSLNLNPGGSTPYLPILRGIAGLDEVLSMRSYRLAGVPSPTATWVQWRVVAQAEEGNPKDQYQGDLWGLYVAVGEMTPKLMSDNKLPDGLTVSTQSGIKHAPKEMADGDKLWEKFVNGMRSNPKEAWWRENLDLQAYFSFHAMNRLLGNVDLRPDGNHGYYRHPDGHWSPIPWDNDMMFVPRHHQPGHIEAIGCLNHPKIAIEYRNRAREILDLFAADATPKGGQVGQLAFDLSNALTPKGFAVDWPRLDEAVWNQHPRMNQKGSYYVNPAHGDHFGGPWKRTLATNDFAGFRKYVIDFATDSRPKKNYAPNDGDHRGYGWGYLAFEAKDPLIPTTPKVEQLPGKFTYRATSTGKTDGVLEWRVGRVGKTGWYELAEHWKQDGGVEISIPADVLKEPGDYCIRARRRDATGRCSHWSGAMTVRVGG